MWKVRLQSVREGTLSVNLESPLYIYPLMFQWRVQLSFLLPLYIYSSHKLLKLLSTGQLLICLHDNIYTDIYIILKVGVG